MSDLKAGRELDALIAERVFGEPRPFTPTDEDAIQACLTGYLCGDPVRNGVWTLTFDYATGDRPEWVAKLFSEDIAAAWTVVEKIRETWECIGVECNEGGWLVEICDDFQSRGQADTAPLAICRAALESTAPPGDTK